MVGVYCKQYTVGIGHVEKYLNSGYHQVVDALGFGVSKLEEHVDVAKKELNKVVKQTEKEIQNIVKKPDLTCTELNNT